MNSRWMRASENCKSCDRQDFDDERVLVNCLRLDNEVNQVARMITQIILDSDFVRSVNELLH